MSDTPIIGFIKEYNAGGTSRLHMPGHKGVPLLGAEELDITEIKGADQLYEPEGIIARSEAEMSSLYGSAATLYSTEGSSLSIKGMLAAAHELTGGLRPAAARNCHRAFINGCVLLDIDPVWIFPSKARESICAADVTAEDVRRTLEAHPELNAVYITSPDYIGSLTDIKGIAEACHERGALLLVDNAHGAYLRFAGEGLHPLEQDADLCCDSAHKTLPCLTGTGLLHISKSAPRELCGIAKEAMSLFASTSPSYVLMSSLDRCTYELKNGLPERIRECCGRVSHMKAELSAAGFGIFGDEPMKLTVSALSKGYKGNDLAEYLRGNNIESEYSDDLCTVLMPSPCNKPEELEGLVKVLKALPEKEPIALPRPVLVIPEKKMTLREAYFSPRERIPVEEAAGRICARSVLSCMPSVPAAVGGEIIDENLIKFLKRYSFFEADVVK